MGEVIDMPKNFWWFLICSIIATLVIPLGVDWLIIGNDFPSNISNSDWVSFFGGYIGSILGCIISLIGILWTINFTREQNRTDRELQVRPCLEFRYYDTERYAFDKNWLGYVDVDILNSCACEPKEVGCGLLRIKNVGNGPATKINFHVIAEGIEDNYQAIFSNKNTQVTTNSIRPNEEAAITISIHNTQKAPSKDEIYLNDEIGLPMCIDKTHTAPSDFKLKLILLYSDILSNHFEQELILDANYYTILDIKRGGQYHCELNMNTIGTPRIKRM